MSESDPLQPISHHEHPAIFLVCRLGDQLISLPSIRALCSIFQSGVQLLLGEGMFSFFYQDLPVNAVTRVWWEKDRARIDISRTISAATSCDAFLSLSTPDAAVAVSIARELNARWTLGSSSLFDREVSGEPYDHMFDRLFAIPQSFAPTLQLTSFCSPPPLSSAAKIAAARQISALRRSGERLLCVHPETDPPKRWSLDNFAVVLERFLSERPEYKVIIFSLEEINLDILPRRIWRCDAHLELALALLADADLFLGIDSCFLHAADLWRIPGVALFGPTSPERWGFRLSPTFRHITAESMEQIRPATVLDALGELAAVVDEL